MIRSVSAAALACCLTAPVLAGDEVEPLTTELTATGLTRPVFATHAPDDYKRLFVLEKAGVIRIVNLNTGSVNPSPFLNINSLVGGGNSNDDERGLLGLAFHPDYQDNGQFYVYYTNNASDTIVARYNVSANPDVANAASAQQVLFINQPFFNHNGGWIGFGPLDGYLYIATGDGGSACDPGNRAQDITNMLMGKVLRLDVDSATPYAIPGDNPFIGQVGDDEIWSFGLRNPWRTSFDRMTGEMYIADVGQGVIEELNVEQPGDGGINYGWDCKEGNDCGPAGCSGFGCGCADSDLVDPVHQYNHGGSPFRCSITGGYVYRGCEIPTLDGTYFYADYCSDQIWSLRIEQKTHVVDFADRTSELDPPNGTINDISSFGEDARGEIYICDQGGQVWKIVAENPTISPYDIDCSGAVDVNDLVAVILAWGPCDGCLEDLDGDDIVGVQDLTLVILNWG
jgi:glucose/arabinose dehydrogenase